MHRMPRFFPMWGGPLWSASVSSACRVSQPRVIAILMTDDFELGWLLAVAGAAVWASRPIAAWIAAFGSARAILAHVKSGDPHPDGLEPLPCEATSRLAALDDEAAQSALEAARAGGAQILKREDQAYPS